MKEFVPYRLILTIAILAQASICSASIGFRENKGQVKTDVGHLADNVLFQLESPSLNMWLTDKGLTYQFFDISKNETKTGEKEKVMSWSRVDMSILNARISKKNIETFNIIKDQTRDYYLGHCKDGILDVRVYESILVKQVLPNIDWSVYVSEDGGVKFDFIVHPGASPDDIQLLYEGAGKFSMNEDQLEFKNQYGRLTEGKLYCYQEKDEISSFYKAEKNEITSEGFAATINISVDKYDLNRDLVIDPELIWSTLYGGTAADGIQSIDVDPYGNTWMSGYVVSNDFPTLNGGGFFQGSYVLGVDAFLLKFDPDGILLNSTYFGGSGWDQCNGLDIDGAGNVWLTGETKSYDLPLQDNGVGYFQGAVLPGGIPDAFIIKFTNSGVLEHSTYFGGWSQDVGNDITIDSQGNIWVTGYTASQDFPVQDGGGYYDDGVNWFDIFLVKMNSEGQLLMSTYFGGASTEAGISITADHNDNIWVLGITQSDDMLTVDCGGFFQPVHGGTFDEDMALLKFDNSGNLLWSTYYGGSEEDLEQNIFFRDMATIASDDFGNVWVMATTNSPDFPLMNSGGYFDGTFSGLNDLVLMKFDQSCNRKFATYLGGESLEYILADASLVLDDCGNAYLGFDTKSSDLECVSLGSCHYYDDSFGGNQDNFIAKFDSSGVQMWGTYIGGTNKEVRNSLAIFENRLYVAGEYVNYTNTSELPLVNPFNGAYYEDVHGGFDDSYIMQFSLLTAEIDTTSSGDCTCDGEVKVDIICSNPPYSYEYSTGDAVLNVQDSTHTLSGLCPGNYWVDVTGGCYTERFEFTITNNGVGTGNVSSSMDTVHMCQGDSLFLDGSFQVNSGFYGDTLVGSNGCDSIVGTELIVIAFLDTLIQLTGCAGFSVDVGNNTYYSSGVYIDTLVGVLGCDSIITTELIIDSVIINDLTFDICQGDTIELNGVEYFMDGVYADTLSSFSGCDSILNITLDVHASPLVNIIELTDTACVGDTIILLASGASGYEWSTGDSIDTLEMAFMANQMISLTGIDINGCSSSDSVNIEVFSIPQLFVQDEIIVCEGEDIPQVGFNLSGGVNWSFWVSNPSLDTIHYQTSNSPFLYSPIAEGVYLIGGLNNESCQSEVMDTLEILSYDGPSIDYMDTIVVCNNATVPNIEFSPATPGVSYLWETIGVDAGQGQSGLSIISTFEAQNNGENSLFSIVEVNAQDSVCLGDTMTLVIEVLPSPELELSISALSGCSPIAFELTSVHDSTQWSFGNDVIQGSSVEFGAVNAGTYGFEVTIIDSNGCKASFNFEDTLIVHANPVADFSFSPEYPDLIDPSVQFSNQSQFGEYFVWSIDGSPFSTLENPFYTLPSENPGEFEVCLLVENTHECLDSVCKTIQIIDPFLLFVPNAFTPEGDGRNDIFKPVISGNYEDYEFYIFNRWGELIFESTSDLEGWDGTSDGVQVPIGVYVWKVGVRESETRRYHERVGHVSVVK